MNKQETNHCTQSTPPTIVTTITLANSSFSERTNHELLKVPESYFIRKVDKKATHLWDKNI